MPGMLHPSRLGLHWHRQRRRIDDFRDIRRLQWRGGVEDEWFLIFWVDVRHGKERGARANRVLREVGGSDVWLPATGSGSCPPERLFMLLLYPHPRLDALVPLPLFDKVHPGDSLCRRLEKRELTPDVGIRW